MPQGTYTEVFQSAQDFVPFSLRNGFMVFFLHPVFLTALACVGIPVVLHFLMRFRPQKLPFPALRFLQSREKNCRRSLRLKHWLLLAVRMALIAFLVLLFARPGFQTAMDPMAIPQNAESSASSEYSNAPTAAIFIFDTSVRMDYVFENRNRLELAQEYAIQILSGLPSQSVSAVLSTHLTSPAFSPDRGEIQRQIQRLQTSAVSRSLPEILPDALALLKTSALKHQEIFIFTDRTAKSWEMKGAGQRTMLGSALQKARNAFPNLRITLVDLGVPQAPNARLEIPEEDAFRMVSGGTAEIRTRLFSSDGKVHRVGIFLMDEKGEIQLRGELAAHPENAEDGANTHTETDWNASVPAIPETAGTPEFQETVERNETAGVHEAAIPLVFQLGGLKDGPNQGFLALLDGDALSADNVRGFTIQKAPPTPILIVANDPAEKNAFFLRQALAPIQFAMENRAGFDCTILSFEKFSRWIHGSETASSEALRRNLEHFRAIFLLDPPKFSIPEWNRLAQYVNSGGGAAFFPGPSLGNVKDFQQAEARTLLPAVPGFQARFPQGTFLNPLLQIPHPILRTFQEVDSPIPWDGSPVFRAWTLEDPKPEAQTLFTWSNGSPALLSAPSGAGRVLLFGTPIHPTQNDSRSVWNLLPRGDSWVFLILMNAAAEYLTAEEEISANILTQEALSFPLRGLQDERFTLQRHTFSLSDPHGNKNPDPTTKQTPVPAGPTDESGLGKDSGTVDHGAVNFVAADSGPLRSSDITLVPDHEHHLLGIPGLEQAGNYRVSGTQSEFLRGFSVNLPMEETDLQTVSQEEIRPIFQPFPAAFLSDVQTIRRSISGSQANSELFHWLGLLILFLLLAENWLANRFYRNGT